MDTHLFAEELPSSESNPQHTHTHTQRSSEKKGSHASAFQFIMF